MCPICAEGELIDPVRDALSGVAELLHGPVGGIALGDVLGRGVVDQPLGQAGREHELAVGDCDEAVAQCMEPEFRPARLANARIEMLDRFEMAGRAGLGWKHPGPRLPRELLPLGEAALQDGGELPGDRELQRLAALGVVDADGHGGHVDLRPGERDHLGEAHACVEAETEGVADDRVAHGGLESPVPARQHLGRRLDAAAARGVQPPSAGAPQLDRIAQIVEVEARPAVDGVQQFHRDVRLYPSRAFGELPETLFDVAAVDVVEGAVEPVAEILLNGAAIVGDRAGAAPGSHGEIVLEGPAQGGHRAAAGALGERVVAQGDAAEDFPGAAARLVGGDRAVAPDDDPPVGRLSPAVAGAVVHEVGAQPGGLNAGRRIR